MNIDYRVSIKWPDQDQILKSAKLDNFQEANGLSSRLLNTFGNQGCIVSIEMKRKAIDVEPNLRLKEAAQEIKRKIGKIAYQRGLRLVK
jgi:hypothetical protein